LHIKEEKRNLDDYKKKKKPQDIAEKSSFGLLKVVLE
jgi:hypothetical protein